MSFMTSLTSYCSIANISSWYTYSPQGPCDVTHTTLTDSPTRYTGCKFTNNVYWSDNAYCWRRDTIL